MKSNVPLILYSAHGEIVGGDAKYFFELINDLPADFHITAFSDINHVFEQRAKQWLKRDVKINYLNTAPKVFGVPVYEQFLMGLAESIAKTPLKFLTKGIGRFNLFYLGTKILDVLTARRLREDLVNLLVFYKVLGSYKDKAGIFHYNNGGYPGKRSGIIGIYWAKKFGLKTAMTIQNYPIDRKSWAPLQALADYIVANYCDVLIPVANKITDKLETDRQIPRKLSRTIYHGLPEIQPIQEEAIDTLRKSLGLNKDDKILLITANLEEERKGHAVLFKAMVSVLKHYPKTYVLVAGDGTKKFEFEQIAKQLGVDKNIKFLGHRTDISELNALCDIATIPSIGFEGIPYTIREAMRAGKPVITTRAGGCDEAVFDGVNGYIIKQADAEDLARAIIHILSDDVLRKEMGLKSYEIFLELFLQKNKVQEHIDLYRELLRP